MKQKFRLLFGVTSSLRAACSILVLACLVLAAEAAFGSLQSRGQCGYFPSDSVFQKGQWRLDAQSAHPGQAPGASGTRDVWHLWLPEVREPFSDYDMRLTLYPGDVLTFDACGCVQTGGAGLTWKRYVDPVGPNSGRLYHGIVVISNAFNAKGLPVRTWQFKGTAVPYVRLNDLIKAQKNGIHLRVTGRTFLILGYEDDDYHDNGYKRHDNGTSNQCAGVGGAQVEIVVDHH